MTSGSAGGSTSGSAKLLLFGEHSAVYGSPAVGLSLPWTLKLAHHPADTASWTVDAPTGADTLLALLNRFEVRRAEKGLPPLPRGRLVVSSDIPHGAGFGSSAALCAALSRFFFPQADQDELDLEAWNAEKSFHGTPSGIDTSLALRRGLWLLKAGTVPLTCEQLPPPSFPLVVGALVRQGDTRSLIAGVKEKFQTPSGKSALTKLGDLAAAAGNLLRALGNSSDLATLVTQAQTVLRSLALSTPALDSLLETALNKTRALAGKLSGAGGGGAFYLLYPNETTARLALPILERALEPQAWLLRPQQISFEAGS